MTERLAGEWFHTWRRVNINCQRPTSAKFDGKFDVSLNRFSEVNEWRSKMKTHPGNSAKIVMNLSTTRWMSPRSRVTSSIVFFFSNQNWLFEKAVRSWTNHELKTHNTLWRNAAHVNTAFSRRCPGNLHSCDRWSDSRVQFLIHFWSFLALYVDGPLRNVRVPPISRGLQKLKMKLQPHVLEQPLMWEQ